jgi:hypothetical protein
VRQRQQNTRKGEVDRTLAEQAVTLLDRTPRREELTFADALGFLRRRRGLRQDQLAQLAGLPLGRLRRIEQHVIEALPEERVRLAKILGASS